MQGTVLQRIVADKAIWLTERSQRQPLQQFQSQITPSDRNFYQALSRPDCVFILECKKASPSKGLIKADFDLQGIADVYRHCASAISVLTDEKYFQGNFDYISQVRARVSQPVLCKDFIIDPYQIYLARYYQADAILLMLSVLDDEQYRSLAAVAHSLNMGVLTEVSNEDELIRAINLKAKVVGINNRDLRDLSIDLDRTRQLAPRLDKDTIIISESGISNHQQVRDLRKFVNGFLIGSALMSEDNLELAVRKVIYGENKVCGLTRPQDAKAAFQAGALFGGLIFAARSPRAVSLAQAKAITQAAPLLWVGVFVNEQPDIIVTAATELALAAVQLHGDESDSYISALRQQLPATCQIWRAQQVTNNQNRLDLPEVDRYLFDQGTGGTGKSFDWSLLKGKPLANVMLAGGIGPDNARLAANIGCLGLDINSQTESAPGQKDPIKLNAVFQAIRDY